MLRNNRTYLIPSVIAAMGIIALASACGSSDDEGSGGSTSVPDEPCTTCATPPTATEGASTGDGEGTTLAINKLYLGDSDRAGTPSQTAWKKFGYDLDGYNSNKNSGTHCKVNEGGTKSNIQTDGDDGIDNSFGANIMPVIVGLQSDAATKINETIEEGSFTIILNVEDVGGGQDYVNLPAALYAGAALETTPSWDGTDLWPVYCELMTTCSADGTPQIPDNKSKVQFPSSYVAGGTWVSGSETTVNLSLAIAGFALSLDINQAVISADMSGGNPPTTATNGVIAGVIESEALINSLVKVAGSISTSLCSGPTLESVKQQITAASDIMKDGTQNPDALCNGISVGIGFDMKAVQLGEVLNQAPEGEDPCAGL
jgi:hypothetical protein